ncbi:MAG: CLC_0170 family protein [Clostridia bacterium]
MHKECLSADADRHSLCIYLTAFVKNNSLGKGGDGMLSAIRENIRSFLDVTIFITMIAIGIFAILGDYRYFKKMKFQKDAAATMRVGMACILLPFILLIIAKL